MHESQPPVLPIASLKGWDRPSTIQKWEKLRLRWGRIVFGVSLRKREDRCLTLHSILQVSFFLIPESVLKSSYAGVKNFIEFPTL